MITLLQILCAATTRLSFLCSLTEAALLILNPLGLHRPPRTGAD